MMDDGCSEKVVPYLVLSTELHPHCGGVFGDKIDAIAFEERHHATIAPQAA
jgi:hypothetical protein